MYSEIEITYKVYLFDYLTIRDIKLLNPILTLELELNLLYFLIMR